MARVTEREQSSGVKSTQGSFFRNPNTLAATVANSEGRFHKNYLADGIAAKIETGFHKVVIAKASSLVESHSNSALSDKFVLKNQGVAVALLNAIEPSTSAAATFSPRR